MRFERLLFATVVLFSSTGADVRGEWNSGHAEYPYQLFVPNSNQVEQYPLVVQLHGKGRRGSDNHAQIAYPPAHYFAGDAQLGEPHFVLAPQMQGEWQPASVKSLIDRIVEAYPIDADRIYCTGQSKGGICTGDLATTYPHLFAAIVPVAGSGAPSATYRIPHLPYWGLHGEEDRTVPESNHRAFVIELINSGGSPRYTVIPNARHNIWASSINVYTQYGIANWLFQFRRK